MVIFLRSLFVVGAAMLSLALAAALSPAFAATHYPVSPGQVGKAKVGMTVKQAMRTGQFVRDVTYVVPGACTKTIELEPKGVWRSRYDVVVSRGRIKEMGISAKRPRSRNGSGVGTTLATLRNRYGPRLTPPREAGYGQWAVFVHSRHTGADRRWIGFLLGNAYTYKRDARPRDVVTFMAVTKGKRPKLVRDGC
jgi:hypothetical protein